MRSTRVGADPSPANSDYADAGSQGQVHGNVRREQLPPGNHMPTLIVRFVKIRCARPRVMYAVCVNVVRSDVDTLCVDSLGFILPCDILGPVSDISGNHDISTPPRDISGPVISRQTPMISQAPVISLGEPVISQGPRYLRPAPMISRAPVISLGVPVIS